MKGEENIVSTDHEHWKERFGFVSGSFLVWGVSLIQIWPSVAMFQTGENIHFWTMRDLDDPNPAFFAFYMLCSILALGIGSLVFSIAHVALRGLWFGVYSHDDNSTPSSISYALDGAAQNLYSGLITLWILTLFALPLYLMLTVAAYIEQNLRTSFEWDSWWLGLAVWLPFPGLYLLSILLVWRFLRRRASNIGTTFDAMISFRIFMMSLIMVTLCLCVAIEMCFTVKLSIEERFFSRKSDQYILGEVSLGGSASDVNVLSLTLLGIENEAVQNIQIQPLESGKYLLVIPVSSLNDGRHTVELTYPRMDINSSHPYFHHVITRRHTFVIGS